MTSPTPEPTPPRVWKLLYRGWSFSGTGPFTIEAPGGARLSIDGTDTNEQAGAKLQRWGDAVDIPWEPKQ